MLRIVRTYKRTRYFIVIVWFFFFFYVWIVCDFFFFVISLISISNSDARWWLRGDDAAFLKWSSVLFLVFGVVVRILKRVPLRDRTPRRRQHVGPVPQFGAGGVVAEHHFADGFGRADAVVVDDSDYQVDFLEKQKTVSKSGHYFRKKHRRSRA